MVLCTPKSHGTINAPNHCYHTKEKRNCRKRACESMGLFCFWSILDFSHFSSQQNSVVNLRQVNTMIDEQDLFCFASGVCFCQQLNNNKIFKQKINNYFQRELGIFLHNGLCLWTRKRDI